MCKMLEMWSAPNFFGRLCEGFNSVESKQLEAKHILVSVTRLNQIEIKNTVDIIWIEQRDRQWTDGMLLYVLSEGTLAIEGCTHS